ncbi:MAG: hypothetical protein HGA95_00075 [Caldiserica bacterium]|nr:hypothetical protein [Caldisericota bacterium]
MSDQSKRLADNPLKPSNPLDLIMPKTKMDPEAAIEQISKSLHIDTGNSVNNDLRKSVDDEILESTNTEISNTAIEQIGKHVNKQLKRTTHNETYSISHDVLKKLEKAKYSLFSRLGVKIAKSDIVELGIELVCNEILEKGKESAFVARLEEMKKK